MVFVYFVREAGAELKSTVSGIGGIAKESRVSGRFCYTCAIQVPGLHYHRGGIEPRVAKPQCKHAPTTCRFINNRSNKKVPGFESPSRYKPVSHGPYNCWNWCDQIFEPGLPIFLTTWVIFSCRYESILLEFSASIHVTWQCIYIHICWTEVIYTNMYHSWTLHVNHHIQIQWNVYKHH